jgi:hypothetical protein
MVPIVSARVAFEDHNLLGREFSESSWSAMKALILAALGEQLTGDERKLFIKLSMREQEPLQRVRRLVIVAGRRSGKSRISAALAIYIALLCDHRANLSVGEKGVMLVIAQNTEQARVVFDYCVGLLNSTPMLRREVASITKEVIAFKNGIEIQIRPSSFRGLRGLTLIGVIADEAAFWFTEESNSLNSDQEIINAVQPALATTKGMMIIISSPYARRGIVWKLYNKHYGPTGDPATLIAQGASTQFNPNITDEEVQTALDEDYAVAQSEWLGSFRTDIEGFITIESVHSCVVPERYELLPAIGPITYCCFVDASTGAGGDSFAAAIGHLRDDTLVLDAIRNYQPKFSPEAVVAEISQLCEAYNIKKVFSDNYAVGFVTELFNRNGITHETIPENKSQLYIRLLSAINSRKIELLDDARTIQELVGLERRTGFAGRDRIDHAPGMHDDSANAVAGLSQIVSANSFNMLQYFQAYAIAGTHAWQKMKEMERQQKEQRDEAIRLQQEWQEKHKNRR